MSQQLQKAIIKNEADYIKGFEDGEKQQKKKDIDEIKKMTRFLWRDDIVKFLEEL